MLIHQASFAEYVSAVDAVKRGGRRLISNCFLSAHQIRSTTREKCCLIHAGEDCAFFLVPRHVRYYECYYFAHDTQALSRSIAVLHEICGLNAPVCVPVIGKMPLVETIWPLFAQNGFALRKRIARMAHSGKSKNMLHANQLLHNDEIKCEFAGTQDAEEILKMLTENFDIYSDDIPELDIIAQDAEQKRIAVIRRDNTIAALCYITMQNGISYGYYALCKEKYRKELIIFTINNFMAQYIMKHNSNISRTYAWRDIDNKRIIHSSAISGEKQDGIFIYRMLYTHEINKRTTELNAAEICS